MAGRRADGDSSGGGWAGEEVLTTPPTQAVPSMTETPSRAELARMGRRRLEDSRSGKSKRAGVANGVGGGGTAPMTREELVRRGRERLRASRSAARSKRPIPASFEELVSLSSSLRDSLRASRVKVDGGGGGVEDDDGMESPSVTLTRAIARLDDTKQGGEVMTPGGALAAGGGAAISTTPAPWERAFATPAPPTRTAASHLDTAPAPLYTPTQTPTYGAYMGLEDELDDSGLGMGGMGGGVGGGLVGDLTAQIEAKEQRIEGLQREVHDTHARLSTLAQELEAARAAESRAREESDATRSRCDKAERSVQQLQTNLRVQKEAVDALVAENASLKKSAAENRELRELVRSQSKRVEELAATEQQQRTHMGEQQQLLDQLQRERERARQEAAGLSGRVRELVTARDELSDALGERDARVDMLQQERHVLLQRLDEVHRGGAGASARDLQDEHARLRAALEHEQAARHEATSSLSRLKSTLDEQEDALQRALQEKNAITAQLIALQDQSAGAQARTAELEAHTQQLEAANAQLLQKVEQQGRQLGAMDEHLTGSHVPGSTPTKRAAAGAGVAATAGAAPAPAGAVEGSGVFAVPGVDPRHKPATPAEEVRRTKTRSFSLAPEQRPVFGQRGLRIPDQTHFHQPVCKSFTNRSGYTLPVLSVDDELRWMEQVVREKDKLRRESERVHGKVLLRSSDAVLFDDDEEDDDAAAFVHENDDEIVPHPRKIGHDGHGHDDDSGGGDGGGEGWTSGLWSVLGMRTPAPSRRERLLAESGLQ